MDRDEAMKAFAKALYSEIAKALENRDVVVERLRHVAKIDQNVANLAPALRLRVHRKPPLTDQVRARRRVRVHIACRPPLDGEALALLRRDELYDLSIGDLW